MIAIPLGHCESRGGADACVHGKERCLTRQGSHLVVEDQGPQLSRGWRAEGRFHRMPRLALPPAIPPTIFVAVRVEIRPSRSAKRRTAVKLDSERISSSIRTSPPGTTVGSCVFMAAGVQGVRRFCVHGAPWPAFALKPAHWNLDRPIDPRCERARPTERLDCAGARLATNTSSAEERR